MTLNVSPVKLGPRDSSIEMKGFTITETVRRSGLLIPQHYHERTNIAFVLSGSFLETVGRQPFEVRPGSVVFRAAGEPHTNQYGDKPAKSLIVEIEKEYFESTARGFDLFGSAFHVRDGVMSNLGLRIHNEFRQMDDASPLAIEGLILEVLAQCVRRDSKRFSPKKPRWLEHARDFIHAEFYRSITLSQVSSTVGVHPSHLAKTFRLHYGCTLGEYVRKLRLDYAEKQLKSSGRTLSEIAISAGFYDQSHFTNTFKFRNGFTPSEFRNLTQNKE